MLLLAFLVTNQRNIPDLQIPRGEKRLSVLHEVLASRQWKNQWHATNQRCFFFFFFFETINYPNQLHCCPWLDTPIISELNIKDMKQHE